MKTQSRPAAPQYLALLRGINVGGKNIIRMPALQACCERLGFAEVSTYIQSGNVMFRAPGGTVAELESALERALSAEFAYAARVVLVPHATLRRVVAQAPAGFGRAPDAYRYDVIFLKAPHTPGATLKTLPLKEGVDAAAAGRHALYFSRLTAKATQSRISRIAYLPAYPSMTIRNWNTTTALLARMDAAGGGRARRRRG